MNVDKLWLVMNPLTRQNRCAAGRGQTQAGHRLLPGAGGAALPRTLQRLGRDAAEHPDAPRRATAAACAPRIRAAFADLIEATVTRAVSAGLVDDSRFTQGRIASLRRRGASSRAVSAKLAAKGVPRDLVADALSQEREAAEAEDGPPSRKPPPMPMPSGGASDPGAGPTSARSIATATSPPWRGLGSHSRWPAASSMHGTTTSRPHRDPSASRMSQGSPIRRTNLNEPRTKRIFREWTKPSPRSCASSPMPRNTTPPARPPERRSARPARANSARPRGRASATPIRRTGAASRSSRSC